MSGVFPGNRVRVLFVIDADGLDANCFDRFNTCLESLARQTIVERLLVSIADFSTDSVASRVEVPAVLGRDYFHRPIVDPFNKPFCINYAFKRFSIAQDPVFFFSDIDLVYPEDFAERYLDRYSRFSDTICATGMTFYQQEKDALYVADYRKARDTIFLDRRYRGGALLISSKLFTELRGYDERYFGWGKEDDDFIMRASRRGMFVVDESTEFVHLFHPNKGLAPTFNTEIFLDRRRERDAWDEDRPWGDWNRRPRASTKRALELYAGYPARMPTSVALDDGGGIRVVSPNFAGSLSMGALGRRVWSLCDGDLTFREIVDEVSREFGGRVDDVESEVRAILERLRKRRHVVFRAVRQIRPMMRLRFADPAPGIEERRFVIAAISQECDVSEAAHDDTATDVVIHTREDCTSKATAGPAMHVLWTRRKPDDESYRRFAFVVSPASVVPEFETVSARLPGWLRLFDWRQSADDLLAPELLTAFRGDPERPRPVLCISSPSRTAASDRLVAGLSDDGEVGALENALAAPADRFERYWESMFVVVDEPGCGNGLTGDDLIIAILAGAIPIYRGDPLVHLDFNCERMIRFEPECPDDALSRIRTLARDPHRRREFLNRPIFNDSVIPYRLTRARAAARLVQSWREHVNRSFSRQPASFAKTG